MARIRILTANLSNRQSLCDFGSIKARKLFHYFRYKPERFDSLINGDLFLSSPSQFNDPLDAWWFLDYDKIIDQRFGRAGRANPYDRDVLRELRQTYDEDIAWPQQNNAFVFCLSETPYSNPMWGNYADNHHGFCIEYDVEKLLESRALLMPVIYSDVPLDASELIDRPVEFESIAPLLFKDSDWEYEREWRLFIQQSSDEKGQKGKVLSLGPESVCGVYAGLRSVVRGAFEAIDAIPDSACITKNQIERSYMKYELTSDTFEDLRSGRKRGLFP